MAFCAPVISKRRASFWKLESRHQEAVRVVLVGDTVRLNWDAGVTTHVYGSINREIIRKMQAIAVFQRST